MILSETAMLVAIIAESLMTEKQIVDVIDLIFIDSGRGGREAVAAIRDVSDAGVPGRHRVDPYLKWKAAGRMGFLYVIELPINFIPVVGAPIFLALQGWHLGPWQHYRYWQVLGLDEQQRKEVVKINRVRYWMFGIMHVCLQLVPVLSIFFLFSTGAGSALWAVEAEKRKGSHAWVVADRRERERPVRWWGWWRKDSDRA